MSLLKRVFKLFNVQVAVLPKNKELAKFLQNEHYETHYEERLAKAKAILLQMGIEDVKPLINNNGGNKRRLGKTTS